MSKKLIFNNTDYESNDGMLTSVWGPALWHSLHIISFNYPVKPTTIQKKYYLDFFTDLQNILPCKYCRDNYKKNLETLPITKTVLKNRENFSRWLYEMHELININLGKKSNLTYDEVRDRFEHFRSRCLSYPNSVDKDQSKELSKDKEPIKEKGCTEPLYGIKSKCIINIVPKESKINSFTMDSKCKLKKI
jgi:hypothetical protein